MQAFKVISVRFLIAAFFAWYGVHEYGALTRWEEVGGTYRMNSLTHMFYDLGGIRLVVGVDLAFAVGCFVWGVLGIRELVIARRTAQ